MDKNLKVMMTSLLAVITVVMSGSVFGMATSDADDAVVENVSTARDRVVDLPSPTTQDEFELLWTLCLAPSSSNYNYAPGTGTVVGDYYYAKIGAQIHKIDISTGDIVASSPSVDANFMYGHYQDYVAYGDGMIVDNTSKTVYDLDLNPLYKLKAAGVTMYHDGYMYVASTTSFCKYDPAVGDLTADDTKEPIWEVAGAGYISNRYYQPVFVDGYAYILYTVNGNWMAAINLENGTVNSTKVPIDYYINGEFTYYNGHLYMPQYTGGIFDSATTNSTVTSIPVNTKTGEFDFNNMKVVDLEAQANTTSVLVFNGFGYIGTASGLKVIDLQSMDLVTSIEPGYSLSRGTLGMTTFYANEENGNKVYLYIVPYENKGIIAVYSHAYLDGEHITTYEGVIDSATKQYCTEGVSFGPNGELIWHNDSMEIRCYANINAALLNPDVGDVNIDGIVDLADAIAIANHVSGKTPLSGATLKAADYDGDGIVNLWDALEIIKGATLSYPVDFDIKDAVGGSVSSADVTIYLDEAMTQVIDRTILPAGTYYYSVEAHGYDTVTGSFVVDNQAVTVNVTLGSISQDKVFIVNNGVLTKYLGEGGFVQIPETIDGQTIIAIGSNAFMHSDVTTLLIPDTVLRIEANAFYDSALVTVMIGAGVEYIDSDAFDGLKHLEDFIVDEGNRYYASMTGILYNVEMTEALAVASVLGDVTIPGSLTTIPSKMFQANHTLGSVVVEYGVTSIGTYAFEGSSLKSITFPASLTSIGTYAFSACDLVTLTIPGSVTNIPQNMARLSESLTTVILQDGVKTIENYGFYGCSSLKSIYLPATLKTLNTNVFHNTAIESLYLPDGVSVSGTMTINTVKELSVGKLGNAAKFSMANLEVLNLRTDADVKVIENNLSNFKNLAQVNVASDNTTLASVDGVLYNKAKTNLVLYPLGKSDSLFQIPDGVTEISKSAFANSTGIEQVIVPASVTTIGASAFSGCKNLIAVVFDGTSITSIGKDAFKTSNAATKVFVCDGFAWNGQTVGITVDSAIKVSVVVGDSVKETFYRAAGVAFGISEICAKYNTIVWSGSDGNIYKHVDEVISDSDIVLDMGDFGISKDGTLNQCYISDSEIVIPETYMGVTVTALAADIIPKTVTSLTIPDITIPSKVFKSYTSLETVVIDTATIPANAFEGCTALVNLTIGSNVKSIASNAFSGCKNLVDLVIPDNVTSLASGTFAGCGVTQITLPAGITSISSTIFTNCASLTTVTFSGKLSSITTPVATGASFTAYVLANGSDVYAVKDGLLYTLDMKTLVMCPSGITNVLVAEGVTSIGSYAFENSNAAAITLPSTLKTIGSYAFNNAGIKNLTLPAGLESIESYAFQSAGLTSVTFPASLKSIGSYAFSTCSSLKEVNFVNGLETIGDYAFKSAGLTSVTFPASLKSIGSYAFTTCNSLKEVNFVEGLETIGTYAFYKSGVVSIVLPKSVTSLGNYAFGSCTSLKYLEVNCNITTVSANLARSSTALESVVITATATTMGGYAFNGCTALKAIYFEGSTIPSGIKSTSVPTTVALYAHGSQTSIDWSSVSSYTHGTFWYVTFDVDGVKTTVPAPSGTLSLSSYQMNDAEGNKVTTWYVGDKSYGATDSIDLTGDLILSNKNGA